jgi:cohesin loading factor subunit SCC2
MVNCINYGYYILLRYSNSFSLLKDDIKDQVCDTLAYFVQQPNEDIQLFTLKAIGSLCIRHYDFMLGIELKTLYHRLLTEDDAPLHMRTQVKYHFHYIVFRNIEQWF